MAHAKHYKDQVAHIRQIEYETQFATQFACLKQIMDMFIRHAKGQEITDEDLKNVSQKQFSENFKVFGKTRINQHMIMMQYTGIFMQKFAGDIWNYVGGSLKIHSRTYQKQLMMHEMKTMVLFDQHMIYFLDIYSANTKDKTSVLVFKVSDMPLPLEYLDKRSLELRIKGDSTWHSIGGAKIMGSVLMEKLILNFTSSKSMAGALTKMKTCIGLACLACGKPILT